MDSRKHQNKLIFDYLKNILTEKSAKLLKEHVEDKENFKSFPFVVIMRYLSMSRNENVRNLIAKNQVLLERLDKISHERFYEWCVRNIPKQQNSYIEFIK